MSTTLEELRRLTLEQQRAETAPAEPPSQPARGSPGGSPSNTQSANIDSQPAESEVSAMEGEPPGEPEMGNSPEARPPFHDDAHLRICANAHLRKHASTQARKHLLAQASEQASAQVLAQMRKQTRENARFLDRVREGIARKTAHPGGIKASVDISPELSLRVKRYCLDHGNVPVRLVFVELLTAFLEEEGY